MVLIYDLRRNAGYRNAILSRVQDQWQAYLREEWPVSVSEGRISELFYAPYEGQHMFRLDEGARTTCWVRQGDDSWYVVGRRVKVEHVVFQVPPPIGGMPVVTRIWIGRDIETEP
jgi:hypothetical protein